MPFRLAKMRRTFVRHVDIGVPLGGIGHLEMHWRLCTYASMYNAIELWPMVLEVKYRRTSLERVYINAAE
jgi:hypothetical protein